MREKGIVGYCWEYDDLFKKSCCTEYTEKNGVTRRRNRVTRHGEHEFVKLEDFFCDAWCFGVFAAIFKSCSTKLPLDLWYEMWDMREKWSIVEYGGEWLRLWRWLMIYEYDMLLGAVWVGVKCL
jgi:hypothetical protein